MNDTIRLPGGLFCGEYPALQLRRRKRARKWRGRDVGVYDYWRSRREIRASDWKVANRTPIYTATGEDFDLMLGSGERTATASRSPSVCPQGRRVQTTKASRFTTVLSDDLIARSNGRCSSPVPLRYALALAQGARHNGFGPIAG